MCTSCLQRPNCLCRLAILEEDRLAFLRSMQLTPLSTALQEHRKVWLPLSLLQPQILLKVAAVFLALQKHRSLPTGMLLNKYWRSKGHNPGNGRIRVQPQRSVNILT
uniref:Uncharacterized protein n=1 Tax=Micrurus paraensis TaxID=1970185 RepID=A0A2D4KPP2_9SAUR